MGTLPNIGATEWAGAQASPWDVQNEINRLLDAFCTRTTVLDRHLTAPPGACADGARYLVDAGATDEWEDQDGKLAIAFGVNASNGWRFVDFAKEGRQLYLEDEEIWITYQSGAWVPSTSDSLLSIQASEAIGAGKFINVYSSGGNPRMRLADGTDPTKFANGFVREAVANGALGKVSFSGLNDAVNPADSYSEVWLSDTTPGDYTTVAPSTGGHLLQTLGVAIEGVGIVFQPGARIEL